MPVDVARDFLPEIRDIADRLLPIDHARNCIPTSVRGSDNGSPLVIGDVAQAKPDAVLFKHMPHRDAERRPGKLDQGEHGVYMPEERGKFKTGRDRRPDRPPARGTRAP